MGEVDKVYFLLAERISSSLTGSFESSGCSFSSHLFMLDLFHHSPALCLSVPTQQNGFVCFPTKISHVRGESGSGWV